MKVFALLATLIASAPTYATFSVNCKLSRDVSVSFLTSSAMGSPITSDITIGSEVVPKSQVVNYMNRGSSLYILILDANVDKTVLELDLDIKRNRGVAAAAVNGQAIKVFPSVSCQLE